MTNLRHVVNVMRPTKNKGTVGESQGQPDVVMRNWPCSIETLQGREADLARQTFASATLKVEGYGDPRNPFKATDYLEFVDGVTGTKDKPRKLYIGVVNDEKQNGIKLTLLCGEER